MAKHRRMSDSESEAAPREKNSAAHADSDNSPVRKKAKVPCRHMYTNEQHRFIWYHRVVLELTATKTHQIFHSYFNPEVKVSPDGLNQLVGRLKRTQPKEVVSATHSEPWAKSFLFGDKNEGKPTQAAAAMVSVPSDKGPASAGPEQERTGAATKNPKTPPSSSNQKRHMYTNEQHRFVWFYRNDLKKDSMQTFQMFQEYFNVPNMKRTTLNQLAGRLKSQMSPDVVSVKHTEAWAIGRPDAEIKKKKEGSSDSPSERDT